MLLDLSTLISDFELQIEGILHIGAHHAEELDLYESLGVRKVIWLEGNPSTYEQLAIRIKGKEGHNAFNLLVSDKEGEEVAFNIASFSQSSSILEFGNHKRSYPDITTTEHVMLKTVRLDKFFPKGLKGINFVNLDIQGAELMALIGMGHLLTSIDYVYLEVNLIHVYKGCARLHQIDQYLGLNGFVRVKHKITKAQWGDAFYIRSTKNSRSVAFNYVQALWLEAKAEIKLLRDRFYKFRKGLL